MYDFSSKATVNKTFTLNELYKRMGADKTIKDEGKLIDSVSLKYVLSEETAGMKSGTVKEIYFFLIKTKNRVIPEKFISSLDGIVKLQTVFILQSDGFECFLTSFKGKDGKPRKNYWKTPWRKEGPKGKVPMINALDDVYEEIVGEIVGYPPFKAETIAEYIARINELRKLDYDIGKLKEAIDRVVESKKRFAYNDKAKELSLRREYLLKERSE